MSKYNSGLLSEEAPSSLGESNREYGEAYIPIPCRPGPCPVTLHLLTYRYRSPMVLSWLTPHLASLLLLTLGIHQA